MNETGTRIRATIAGDCVGRDFSGECLAFTDLSEAALNNANMVGCDLTGAKISLVCDTFDGVQIDRRTFDCLMFLISKLQVVDGEMSNSEVIQLNNLCSFGSVNVVHVLRTLITPERKAALIRMFEEQE